MNVHQYQWLKSKQHTQQITEEIWTRTANVDCMESFNCNISKIRRAFRQTSIFATTLSFSIFTVRILLGIEEYCVAIIYESRFSLYASNASLLAWSTYRKCVLARTDLNTDIEMAKYIIFRVSNSWSRNFTTHYVCISSTGMQLATPHDVCP